MRVLILVVALLLPSITLAAKFGGYTLSPEQQRLLHLAGVVGEPYDLKETSQAILFQETLAGAFGDGIGDKINGYMRESYGVMQVKLVTAKWVFWKKPHLYADLFPTPPTDVELRDALINDDIINIRVGVANLYLIRQYTNNWAEMVVAYNTGINGMRALDNPREHHYYKLVARKLNSVIRPFNKHQKSQEG